MRDWMPLLPVGLKEAAETSWSILKSRPTPFIFSAGCEAAGSLLKAAVYGTLVTGLVGAFLPDGSNSLGQFLPNGLTFIVLIIGLTLIFPIIMGLDYFARAMMLRVEYDFSQHTTGNRIGLFWSIAAMLSGIARFVTFFTTGLILAPIPTILIALIGGGAYSILRAHGLLEKSSGAARTRAVFEGVGRVNFAADLVAGLAFMMLFLMASFDVGFPSNFGAEAIIYIFLIRFMLSALQNTNVALLRLIATGSSGTEANQE